MPSIPLPMLLGLVTSKTTQLKIRQFNLSVLIAVGSN